MKFLFNTRPISSDIAALLLRVFVGGLFTFLGGYKLFFYSNILSQFHDIIGIGRTLSFNLLIFAELGCGFLVLIGLLTRLAVWPIIFAMCVAFFIAHAKDPFFAKQLPLLLMLLCVVIFVAGAGRFSIDRLFERRMIVRKQSSDRHT